MPTTAAIRRITNSTLHMSAALNTHCKTVAAYMHCHSAACKHALCLSTGSGRRSVNASFVANFCATTSVCMSLSLSLSLSDRCCQMGRPCSHSAAAGVTSTTIDSWSLKTQIVTAGQRHVCMSLMCAA